MIVTLKDYIADIAHPYNLQKLAIEVIATLNYIVSNQLFGINKITDLKII